MWLSQCPTADRHPGAKGGLDRAVFSGNVLICRFSPKSSPFLPHHVLTGSAYAEIGINGPRRFARWLRDTPSHRTEIDLCLFYFFTRSFPIQPREWQPQLPNEISDYLCYNSLSYNAVTARSRDSTHPITSGGATEGGLAFLGYGGMRGTRGI
jgi:hypothetical protein